MLHYTSLTRGGVILWSHWHVQISAYIRKVGGLAGQLAGPTRERPC